MTDTAWEEWNALSPNERIEELIGALALGRSAAARYVAAGDEVGVRMMYVLMRRHARRLVRELAASLKQTSLDTLW